MMMTNKRKLKEPLDEMQIQTRNKIGNQCFFMLFFLLMINLGLQDYVRWAASPMSVYTIIVLTMGYYMTRVVWAGAYGSTLTKSVKPMYLIGLLVASTIILSLLGIIRNKFLNGNFNLPNDGALRMFIFSFVFIMIIFVSSKISNLKNNQGND